MVTTDDIGLAQLFFLLGNLCFLAKIIFSRELEVEYGIPSLLGPGELYAAYSENRRVTSVTIAVFAAILITGMESSWADGKRIHPLPTQPASLQAPLAPAYVVRVVPTMLNPSSPRGIPDPKTKIIPPASGEKGLEKKSVTGKQEKPKPVPSAYPIVAVSETKVIYDKDTGKITVSVSVGNTTQSEFTHTTT